MDAIRAQEWWLPALGAGQAWRATQGAGVTVAVLGTGVAATHPDLSGDVITGPDYTGSGRAPGGAFWGTEGTAVAAIIAGHGHGSGQNSGIVGIAPQAKILSVRVTLEFNDPLGSDQAIARRLPGAIAAGIRYAVDNGARIIDLPLDPGTLGLTGQGDPAAAGGSAAERAAVAYALSKNVVLIAPAGNDGQGPGIVNYPAAYPGVIAVGAVGRNGQLALFSSRRSYVSLTAPGVSLEAAAPPDGYGQISTTSTASGLVAGVAALLLAKFPHLTVAQVTQALTESTALATTQTSAARLPSLPARSADGAGYGTVNAGRAMAVAALILSPPKAPAPTARPARSPARPAQPAAAPSKATAGTLAGSLVRYIVIGLMALVALLAALLVLMRSRRARAGSAPDTGRAHTRGVHEHRRPPPRPGQNAAAIGAGSPPATALPSPGGWQGSGLGEIASPGSFRPAVAPVSRSTASPRAGRGAGGSSGPPWEPAPPPERVPNPLPMVSRSAFPQASGSGIRVPRDMPTARTDPPRSTFDFTVAADSVGATDFPTRPDRSVGPDLPTRQSLGFAAAPVPGDYAAPPGMADYPAPGIPAELTVHHEAPPGPAFIPRPADNPPAEPEAGPPPAAEPRADDVAAAAPGSYVWDIAATDVFPIRTDTTTPSQAPGAAPPDDAPGASDG